jgi:2-amino-4-hydroxy-6-hydroxymethyldihydropteridine diphosphokinase
MIRRMVGYVALGSNLGDRRQNMGNALHAMSERGLTPIAVSSVWETEPVDSPSFRWFWNMTVEVRTNRTPLGVLDSLLGIECQAGRDRRVRNGPRQIDLDLLLLGDLIIDHDRLCLPHPRMWQRRFVLEPLAEIAPRLVNPSSGRTVIEELDALSVAEQVRCLGALASC